MSRFLGPALVAAASSVLVASLAAQAPASVRSAIQQAVRAYVEAYNKADASTVMEMYSREAGVTSIAEDGGVTRGWDAIRRGWDAIRAELDSMMELADPGRYKITLGSIDVTSMGPGYALAVATYSVSFETEQGDVQIRGAMSLVFKRITAEWKIIHAHASTEGQRELAGVDEGLTPSIAAMRSDLRSLVVAEEAFFADSIRYTERIGRGGIEFAVSASEGNTLPVIKVTRDGFTASIGNVNTRKRCAIFVGSTPLAPAMKEGEPRCS